MHKYSSRLCYQMERTGSLCMSIGSFASWIDWMLSDNLTPHGTRRVVLVDLYICSASPPSLIGPGEKREENACAHRGL